MISIITPIWNRSDLTYQFLAAHWQQYVKNKNPNIDFEIIIVNNGSTDNTSRVVGKWEGMYGNLMTVINLPENTGFGPGNNLGAQNAKGDIFVFAENDIFLSGDYLALIKKEMKEDVLIGPALHSESTGWNNFGDLIIPYLDFCLFACTHKTWEKLGGFDERFVPCDYEDIDMCYTAQQKNIELKALKLPIRHAPGQTAQTLSGGRLQVTLKNQALFRKKWQL